jgi:hypothetical protein
MFAGACAVEAQDGEPIDEQVGTTEQAATFNQSVGLVQIVDELNVTFVKHWNSDPCGAQDQVKGTVTVTNQNGSVVGSYTTSERLLSKGETQSINKTFNLKMNEIAGRCFKVSYKAWKTAGLSKSVSSSAEFCYSPSQRDWIRTGTTEGILGDHVLSDSTGCGFGKWRMKSLFNINWVATTVTGGRIAAGATDASGWHNFYVPRFSSAGPSESYYVQLNAKSGKPNMVAYYDKNPLEYIANCGAAWGLTADASVASNADADCTFASKSIQATRIGVRNAGSVASDYSLLITRAQD